MIFSQKSKNNERFCILSINVDNFGSTKGLHHQKSVCNISGTHSLICKGHFVHFDLFIGGMDKRQK
jgi:hypothetical protein